MTIEYKIVAFDASRAQITVKFFSPDIPDGIKHSIDLPIQGGLVLDLRGEVLAAYIQGFMPVAEFERANVLKRPQDFSYIQSLVEPEPVEVLVVEEPVNIEPLIT